MDLTQDNIYKYLGLGVVSILVIYIGVKTLTFQAKMIEGMTNQTTQTKPTMVDEIANILLNSSSSTSTTELKNINNKLNDILAVSKNRVDYENAIIALEELCNTIMFAYVQKTADDASKNKVSIHQNIATANQFKAFIDTLNASMKYIDKKK